MKRALYLTPLISVVCAIAAGLPVVSAAVTRTPRPNAAATRTAIKPTVQNAATKAAGTAVAAKKTAAALATQAVATATALRNTVTPPAKVSAEDAAAAIQAYADTVLGISVSVTQAGGLTGQVNRMLTQTTTGSSAQSVTVKLAAQTYGALLSNGAASLSYGTGTLSGDVTVDVQGSSLGIYSLVVANTATLDANSALTLATQTFPGLAGRQYTTYAVNKGYAWYFKGATTGIDVKTLKAVTLAEAIVLYVLPSSAGKASVSATVGRGDFAANLKVP